MCRAACVAVRFHRPNEIIIAILHGQRIRHGDQPRSMPSNRSATQADRNISPELLYSGNNLQARKNASQGGRSHKHKKKSDVLHPFSEPFSSFAFCARILISDRSRDATEVFPVLFSFVELSVAICGLGRAGASGDLGASLRSIGFRLGTSRCRSHGGFQNHLNDGRDTAALRLSGAHCGIRERFDQHN